MKMDLGALVTLKWFSDGVYIHQERASVKQLKCKPMAPLYLQFFGVHLWVEHLGAASRIAANIDFWLVQLVRHLKKTKRIQLELLNFIPQIVEKSFSICRGFQLLFSNADLFVPNKSKRYFGILECPSVIFIQVKFSLRKIKTC